MRLLGTVIVTLLFSSCRPNIDTGADSGLHQLFQDPETCRPVESRRQMIRDNYLDLIRRSVGNGRYTTIRKDDTSKDIEDALDYLSVVPDDYLKFVLEEHRVPIYLRRSNRGNTAGVTQFRGSPGYPGGGVYWQTVSPNWIWVGPKGDNFHPLTHEMGHASLGKIAREVARTQGDTAFQDATRSYYSRALTTEGRNYRRYARSSYTEWQAESFDTFYCGPESRARMQREAPRAHEYALKYFVDPVNDPRPAATPAPTPTPQPDNPPPTPMPQPNPGGNDGPQDPPPPANPGDADGDGVNNETDKCANTPLNHPMWKTGKYAGCGSGQYTDKVLKPRQKDPKGDADEDGIPNFEDICTNTPFKMRIWTYGQYKGCSPGQLPGI